MLPSPADLLAALPVPTDVLAWVRNGEGLVGWGEVARFEPEGPGRFAAADAWWREFAAEVDVHDEVGLPGTGPVAFVSMAFADEPGRSVVVVPRVVVGRLGDTTWITEFEPAGPAARSLPVRRPSVLRYAEGELSVPGYRAAVRAAVERMRAGEVAKVVLAHDLTAHAEEPVDQRFLLHNLAARYPGCWTFAVDGLVGATPELLLRRQDGRIASRVLAGTTWPRSDMTLDALADALLSSPKDRAEHAYAVRSLAEAIAPFCADLSVPDEPHVLRLPNVLHLASDVSGRAVGHASLLRLAEAAHPTAAVGGTPTPDALRLIAELEGMNRGRYAGPVGWVGADGDGELGIALRCAEVDGDVVRMFAGCGIVADSDPDREVEEAEAKFRPIRDALEG
ncbi:isochorismate synthase [Streptoalloteichus tenebrarius]|uniref:isochorismate synthase n=1 Tax=Streptoalloteichus tenebrarius (strain ATCC 17920 / DSM 40477 / JCM 4838 / CBS 697.72 / NBRC 16177 / NCIMB 11028 / NRRL B-12390 / A12253. 1 / ISP 5477) TaxID=1933 RepID=A0ABT1HYI1_STRSD|nr:isochorismate synthase [Streptoalloteichus tenebrarius]BFF02472.1 chorismate-binding protein [Streptoalloteichus tenebrarius]